MSSPPQTGAENQTHVMTDEGLSESVEELRAKLETMKKLMEEQVRREDERWRYGREDDPRRSGYKGMRRESIIDGTFLSAVFGVVFVLIIGVSFYAFQNLYYAILKKFPSKHTEL